MAIIVEGGGSEDRGAILESRSEAREKKEEKEGVEEVEEVEEAEEQQEVSDSRPTGLSGCLN